MLVPKLREILRSAQDDRLVMIEDLAVLFFRSKTVGCQTIFSRHNDITVGSILEMGMFFKVGLIIRIPGPGISSANRNGFGPTIKNTDSIGAEALHKNRMTTDEEDAAPVRSVWGGGRTGALLRFLKSPGAPISPSLNMTQPRAAVPHLESTVYVSIRLVK